MKWTPPEIMLRQVYSWVSHVRGCMVQVIRSGEKSVRSQNCSIINNGQVHTHTRMPGNATAEFYSRHKNNWIICPSLINC